MELNGVLLSFTEYFLFKKKLKNYLIYAKL
jgi:hypothetical protein